RVIGRALRTVRSIVAFGRIRWLRALGASAPYRTLFTLVGGFARRALCIGSTGIRGTGRAGVHCLRQWMRFRGGRLRLLLFFSANHLAGKSEVRQRAARFLVVKQYRLAERRSLCQADIARN